jgi:hypothetical protein
MAAALRGGYAARPVSTAARPAIIPLPGRRSSRCHHLDDLVEFRSLRPFKAYGTRCSS